MAKNCETILWFHTSSLWKRSFVIRGDHRWLVELLLLFEGVFFTCFFLLQENSLSFLKRFYLLFLFIERIFFVCSLIFFWSIQSCSSHTRAFLGSSFSFLTFCLDTSFRTWFSSSTKFINFFMTKEVVLISRANTCIGWLST